MTTTHIIARAKAFTGYGIRTYKMTVDDVGTVRVWDNIAGHYTVCHSLSPTAIRRIRKLSKETP